MDHSGRRAPRSFTGVRSELPGSSNVPAWDIPAVWNLFARQFLEECIEPWRGRSQPIEYPTLLLNGESHVQPHQSADDPDGFHCARRCRRQCAVDSAFAAAKQSDVVAACKRTKGCVMYPGTNGGVGGCSPHACFSCTKGKCVQTAARPSGGGQVETQRRQHLSDEPQDC